MVRSIAPFVLACFTFPSGPLWAQEPIPENPLNENAALSYWQAFALLPQIDDDLRKKLASTVLGKSPVDDEIRELVDASENALLYLDRGAKIDACGWGVAIEKGPYAYLPHLSKTRELTLVALLRARIRFAAGQVEEGMDDAIAAIQLGRDAGQEGVIVLINILVGFAVETEAIITIADSLHHLSPAQRDEFERRLDQIRPEFDMQVALQGEKDVFLGWLIREIEGGRSSDAIMDLMSGDIEARITDRVKTASQEQLLKWARELGAVYDAGTSNMLLSPSEAIHKEEELMAQLRDEKSGNPLGELFLPSFGSARRAEATFLTRKALQKAAFAVFENGPTILNRPAYRDPFGDGPFELMRVETGAELVSDLKRGDAQVKIRVPGLPE